MLKIEYQGQFKKDFKLAVKRGCNPALLAEIVNILANEQPLPPKYKDHHLTTSRNYKGMRECHIQPDWLLVYEIRKETLILRLVRTGSHSDLF